jgi:serine/threonine protein kinase
MDIPHIPDYELRDEIASSSLTRCFNARHRAGGFDCVVKTTPNEAAADSVTAQMIIREARLGLAVRNPHVVKLLDAHVHCPPYYLVTLPLTGKSLANRLLAGPLEWDHALRVAREVATALEAIHRFGHVHANLQPANIIVTSDGSAIVTELGWAHRPTLGPISKCEMSDHSAPELFDSERHTFASDWFSFGLILAELLGDSPAGQSERHPDILPFRPRHDRSVNLIGWSFRLSALVARLTSPSAAKRPKSGFIVSELGQVKLQESGSRMAA